MTRVDAAAISALSIGSVELINHFSESEIKTCGENMPCAHSSRSTRQLNHPNFAGIVGPS
jgi:hypothetical protein